MIEMKSRLFKGAMWIGAGNIFVNALGFISTMILARLLVPEDFGLVAIAYAVMTIFSAVTDMALSQALVQHDDPSDDHFHTAWTMSVIRSIILAIALAVCASPLASFYDDSRLEFLLFLIAISIAFSGFTNPKLIVFQRRLEFHQVFILSCTNKLVSFAITVGLAFIYRSYWALVIGPLVAQITEVLLSYILIPYRPKPRLAEYRELLSFSIWMTLGNWVTSANMRADPLVLGYFLPVNVLGQYSVGSNLSSQTIFQLIGPVKQVLFPAFSRLKHDMERFRRAYSKSQGILCLFAFPIGCGLAVLADEVVGLVLGAKWEFAAPVIEILAFVTGMKMVENVNSVAMATGNTKQLFYRDVREFLIRWPLVLLGLYLGRETPYTMLIGALVGRAFSIGFNTFWNMTLIRDITAIRVRTQLATVWRPAVGAAAMVVCVYALKSGLPAFDVYAGDVYRLCLLIAAGALTYVITLAILWTMDGRREGIEIDAVHLIRDLVSRKLRKVSG